MRLPLSRSLSLRVQTFTPSCPSYLFLLILLLGLGCSGIASLLREGESIEQRDLYEAHSYYSILTERYPFETVYRQRLDAVKSKLALQETAQAQTLIERGDYQQANTILSRFLSIYPAHPRAVVLANIATTKLKVEELKALSLELERSGQTTEAAELVRQALRSTPTDPALTAACERLTRVLQNKESSTISQPAEVIFENAKMIEVVEAIASLTGTTILLAPELHAVPVTLHIQASPLENVLEYFTVMTGLFKVRLDERTILLVADSQENRKRYKRIESKLFHLVSAEAVKVADLIRPHFDDLPLLVNPALNTITVIGTPEQLDLVAELIKANDARELEMILDVEILEVNRTKLRELGIELSPSTISSSITGPVRAQAEPNLTLQTMTELGSGNVLLTLPSLYLNFLREDATTKVLANPRMRILTGAKAQLHIGEKVPIKVVTSVYRDTSEETSSYEYKDIGIKLEVLPVIHRSNEISVDLKLEVSSITHQDQNEQPTIGTRQITTALRLTDGQPEILAGLIRTEERIHHNSLPVLGEIPLIGRYFGADQITATQTEIIMTLTPHIIRPADMKLTSSTQLWTGSATDISGKGLGAPRYLSPIHTRPGEPTGLVAVGTDSAESSASPTPGVSESLPDGSGRSKAHLRLSPDPAGLTQGETIELRVIIQNAENVGSIPFYLGFDPGIIQVEQAVEGSFLNSDAAPTSFMTAIDNRNGRVIVGLTRLGTEQGIDGSGTVLVLTVSGVAAGTSTLPFTNCSVRDPASQKLPAEYYAGTITVTTP